jgi:hypothetical protein
VRLLKNLRQLRLWQVAHQQQLLLLVLKKDQWWDLAGLLASSVSYLKHLTILVAQLGQKLVALDEAESALELPHAVALQLGLGLAAPVPVKGLLQILLLAS